MEYSIPWFVHVAYFFGGAVLANAVPHLLAGIARQPFPTPFASPPFRGLSSPAVNIAWALANVALAWVLLVGIGAIDVGQLPSLASAAAGFALMSALVARSLRRLRTATNTDQH
jgi:hypothetical protein